MKMMPLRKRETIKPPFKNDIADLVGWVRPITALVKVQGGSVGGVLVSSTIVATTQTCKESQAQILLPCGKWVRARKSDYDNKDFYFSYYVVDEKTEWIGLPFRTEEYEPDTFLFSLAQEKVIRFEPITNDCSRALEAYEETEELRILADMESTLPVVDQFGYFVGLAIGSSEGEVIVQPFCMKGTKL